LVNEKLTRTTFLGVENIPVEGGILIACNHMSRMDIPVLFITPNRPEMTALVTTKYLKYPLLRWFIVTAEGIWLDRETADFSAFQKAVEALQQGKAVGISPEGTRSQTAKLLEGKPGAALLALRTGVPVIPVALSGTEDSADKMRHFKRPSSRLNTANRSSRRSSTGVTGKINWKCSPPRSCAKSLQCWTKISWFDSQIIRV